MALLEEEYGLREALRRRRGVGRAFVGDVDTPANLIEGEAGASREVRSNRELPP